MGLCAAVPAPQIPIKLSVLSAVPRGFDGIKLFSDISDVDVNSQRRRRRRRRRRRHAAQE